VNGPDFPQEIRQTPIAPLTAGVWRLVLNMKDSTAKGLQVNGDITDQQGRLIVEVADEAPARGQALKGRAGRQEEKARCLILPGHFVRLQEGIFIHLVKLADRKSVV